MELPKKAYLFPGQGSQRVGMGEELFDKFQEEVALTDSILGYSIKQLCLESDFRKLGQTQFTQPALYLVNSLHYLNSIQNKGSKPDFVAGHSLGEYTALFAAGVFDFETGLRLVKKRGELMAKIDNGAMAAIVGTPITEVNEFLKNNDLEDIDIANINSLTQIVISGLKDRLALANEIFLKTFNDPKKSFIPLNTSGAFHSRYMQEVQEEFIEYVGQFTFNEPTIPILCNAEASFFQKNEVANLLAKQLVQSVKWVEIIQLFKAMGVEEFEEKGPGDTLTKLTASILKHPIPEKIKDKAISLLTPKGFVGNITSHLNEVLIEKSPKNQENFGAKSRAMSLGNSDFRKKYHLRYAYLVSGLQGGIVSPQMLKELRSNNILCFIGTSFISIGEIENIIKTSKENKFSTPYGLTIMFDQLINFKEREILKLATEYHIHHIEAIGYLQPSIDLVRYKLSQISETDEGLIVSKNKIFARVSRPEIAKLYLAPPSSEIIDQLLEEGSITQKQANQASRIAIADELIIENNSGWNYIEYSTEVLLPLITQLRDELYQKHRFGYKAGIGVAGDIGTSYSASTAFLLGADFIVTDTINFCSKESNLSPNAKQLLQEVSIQDIEFAPSFNQFEIGGKIKTLRKGVFFPARANILYDLYKNNQSILDIDEKTKEKLENRYFGKSLDEVWHEAQSCICFNNTSLIKKAENNPKYKMALIFRWYSWKGWTSAINGDHAHKVNYQIFCSPALGAFNQWVSNTEMEKWDERSSSSIAEKIMIEATVLIDQRLQELHMELNY
ncbi:ACP S-malonyltransferase [Ascidiimonas sp. W6]|uniref:ACP S-malonyltransferase n=1 Tax=Ascidiimonas meishanensis TaxID=3128903 RepID=UPI0030ED41C2